VLARVRHGLVAIAEDLDFHVRRVRARCSRVLDVGGDSCLGERPLRRAGSCSCSGGSSSGDDRMAVTEHVSPRRGKRCTVVLSVDSNSTIAALAAPDASARRAPGIQLHRHARHVAEQCVVQLSGDSCALGERGVELYPEGASHLPLTQYASSNAAITRRPHQHDERLGLCERGRNVEFDARAGLVPDSQSSLAQYVKAIRPGSRFV
jgi:hypothetical protein